MLIFVTNKQTNVNFKKPYYDKASNYNKRVKHYFS